VVNRHIISYNNFSFVQYIRVREINLGSLSCQHPPNINQMSCHYADQNFWNHINIFLFAYLLES